MKIDIINLSLGHPIYESPETDPLVGAVEDAARAGIVVVASAGNYGINQETGAVGYAGITSPGNAPSAITIGAVDTNQTVGSQRRHGGSVQLARSSVVFRTGQTRPGGARAPLRRGRGLSTDGSTEEHPERRVNGNDDDRRGTLSPPEWHEHGRRGHERRGGADDRRQPADARRT